MTEGSGRDETSVAPNAPDYARVIEHGNAILDAERVMTQFALEGTGAAQTRAAAAASDPLATYAFHLGASNIASALDHLRTVAQVVQTAVIPSFRLCRFFALATSALSSRSGFSTQRFPTTSG